MDDKIQKDNLTDLASSLATQGDNSQPQQSIISPFEPITWLSAKF